MRYIQYVDQGNSKLGLLAAEKIFAVEALLQREVADFNQLILTTTPAEQTALKKALAEATSDLSLNTVQLLAPIQRPLHDILAVGVNYYDHVIEAEKALDEQFQRTTEAVFFSKRALRILGDGEDLTGAFDLDEELDYEAELAVIIGKGGKDISREAALDHIFGYSVFNDFSSRKLQRAHQQWFKGKSLDGYSAMGPCIVTKDEFDLKEPHEIGSIINGGQRQKALISQMMTSVPEIIQQLSAGMTLQPGDIIATGTPAGVAMGMAQPQFLKAGDQVTCYIEGIGELRNQIK